MTFQDQLLERLGEWVDIEVPARPPKPYKASATLALSPEMKADMGLPLSDEDRAYLDAQEARLDAYRSSWRYRWYRLKAPWRIARGRVTHAARTLLGVDDCCHREADMTEEDW